jgi:hypothetical protein
MENYSLTSLLVTEADDPQASAHSKNKGREGPQAKPTGSLENFISEHTINFDALHGTVVLHFMINDFVRLLWNPIFSIMCSKKRHSPHDHGPLGLAHI